MADPRYEPATLRRLVTHENVTGRHLIVTFTCPRTRKHVNARWTVPDPRSIGQAVARQATTSLWWELRRTANSLLSQALGSGIAGRVASNAMNTAMSGAVMTNSGPRGLTAEERDQALVSAFRSVEGQFSWTGTEWIGATAAIEQASALEKALKTQPLTGYDKQVLARMCLEIASAHGGISAEEQSQLEEAIDPAVGSLQALAARPPLSRAELQETSPRARVPLLALASAVAFADEHLADAEKARLDQLADGLALNPKDRATARELACGWVLDQWFERAFEWGGHDAHLREQAVELGARLGMTRDEVEVAEARFQRRRAGG
jgi:hypothetical protein